MRFRYPSILPAPLIPHIHTRFSWPCSIPHSYRCSHFHVLMPLCQFFLSAIPLSVMLRCAANCTDKDLLTLLDFTHYCVHICFQFRQASSYVQQLYVTALTRPQPMWTSDQGMDQKDTMGDTQCLSYYTCWSHWWLVGVQWANSILCMYKRMY